MKTFFAAPKSWGTNSYRGTTSSDSSLPASTSPALKLERNSTTPLLEKLYRGVGSPIRLLPNFLIIGAQRGGTTSLYNYLQAYPCIGAASTKEIHFFDRRFNEGLAWYRGHFPTRVEKYYAQHIHKRDFLTGEATPCYLFYPHASKRVAEILPHIKLIVLLRNPVDRAYSQYYHAIEHGFETLPFEEAIEGEEDRVAREREKILNDEYYYSIEFMERAYLARGIYVDQLQAWMGLFPREQFLIIKSEEFYADPTAVLRNVLAFLNVPEAEIQLRKEEYKPYNKFTYNQMNPALRKRLVGYFESHNARLYDYLGFNFGWDR